MRKASEYGRGILSILSRSLRTAIDLLGLLGLVWGCAILYELIRTEGNMQMTMQSSILAWGAIFLVAGFVGSFIAYTVMFFCRYEGETKTGETKTQEKQDKKEIVEKVAFNVSPDFASMNRRQIIAFFEGLAKMCECIYWVKENEVQHGKKTTKE